MPQLSITKIHSCKKIRFITIGFFINAHRKAADTTDDQRKQEWINKQINVMEFFAIDQYMHHLSPDRIKNDTLVMYEPGYDGMSYYFTKVK